jgi:hypothetical protein
VVRAVSGRLVIPVREILRRAAVDRRLVNVDSRVLAVLQAHTRADDGWCVRNQRTIASELGVNRVTVMRSIARLTGSGYLAVDHRRSPSGGNTVASYRIRLPADQLDLLIGTPGDTGASAPGDTGASAPGVVGDSAPESPVNPLKEEPLFELPLKKEQTHTRRADAFDSLRRKKRSRYRKGVPTIDEGQIEMAAVTAAVAERLHEPRGRPPARDRRMGKDWAPSDIDRAWARARGLGDAEIDEVAESCRDHWEIKSAGATGPPAAPAWRKYVKIYIDRGAAAARERGGKDHEHRERRRAGGETHAERLDAAFRAFGGNRRGEGG